MTALRGLYAITDPRFQDSDDLAGAVASAIAGGARIVQYRDKSTDHIRRLLEAREILAVCRDAGVPLLINDDLELAMAIGADGVHLGQGDGDPVEARRRLGPNRLLGVTCHDRLELAQEAAALGADYVAFGSFFPSTIKPEAVPAEIGLLHRAARETGLPVVAIGGISPENGAALVAAGADMLAVISAVFGAQDVEAAARAFQPAFEPSPTE